jgi:hypothetical protein
MDLKQQLWMDELAKQRLWIEKCGGTREGYIRHYGDPGVPPVDDMGNPRVLTIPDDLTSFADGLGMQPVPGQPGVYYFQHFGDGGSAIWKADTDYLKRLEAQAEMMALNR